MNDPKAARLRILQPKAELMTPDHWFGDMGMLVERCGRTSHKSEDAAKEGSHDRFIRKIAFRLGHESIVEHVSITVMLIGSRAMSHQLVRHRLAAYCLTGDTEVVAFSRLRGNPKRWTLKQLYDWSNDPKRKSRLKLIRLRSVDDQGKIVAGKISKVLDTGLQHVFQVKTRCDKAIRCTENEWFLTDTGWKQLHELSVGDRVRVNGTLAYKDPEWLRRKYLEENLERKEVARLAGVSDACIGIWVRRFGLQKPKTAYPNRKPGHGRKGMHGVSGKKAIAKRMTGDGNHRWKGEDAGDQAGRKRARYLYDLDVCDCCDNSATHHHHIDKNTRNNKSENVLQLCDKCHASHHVGQAVLNVYDSPITSILAAGVERTYDLEMLSKDHNFVAEGFVVHNTQESQRYCDYSREAKFDHTLNVIVPPSIRIFNPNPGLDTDITVHSQDNDLVLTELWSTSVLSHLNWGKPAGSSANATQMSSGVFYDFASCLLNSYQTYLKLRNQDVPAEDARFVLPNACKTEVATTYNVRQWRHVFKLRCDRHAQWEIRTIMKQVLKMFIKRLPYFFDDLHYLLED